MIDALFDLIDRAISLVDRVNSRRRRLYEDHVDPLFTSMKVIHSDYSLLCEEVRQAIEDENSDIDALLRKVRTDRLRKEGDRRSVRRVSEAIRRSPLGSTTGSVFSSHANLEELSIPKLVFIFAEDIERYFRAAVYGQLPTSTHSMSIITILERLQRERTRTTVTEIEFELARQQLAEIVEYINEMFDKITLVYAELRVKCLAAA